MNTRDTMVGRLVLYGTKVVTLKIKLRKDNKFGAQLGFKRQQWSALLS